MSEARSLAYYPWLRKYFWWAVVALILLSALLYGVRWWTLPESDPYELRVANAVLAALFPWGILLRLFWTVRPKLYADYILYPDRLIEKRGSKERVHQFSQVREVRVSLFPPRFGGGFSLYFESGQTLHFYSLLAGSEEVLKTVLRKTGSNVLDRRAKAYLFKIEHLEVSLGRLRRQWQKPLLILVRYLVLPVLVAEAFYWLLELQGVWLLVTYVGAFVLNGVLALGLSEGVDRILLREYEKAGSGSKIERSEWIMQGASWLVHGLTLFAVVFYAYWITKS